MTAEETSETVVPSQDTQVTIALMVPLLSWVQNQSLST